VVTGASRGIGRAIALELAAAGAHVVLHARTGRAAAEAAAEQIRRGGGNAHVETADLADPRQALALVQRCWEWQGRVDIWVNNAGADVLTGDAADVDFDEKLRRLWQVDVLGTVMLSRQVGQRMRASGGVILNMGWDQAETGMEGDSGEMFAATKGAVMAFTRSLAKSLAPRVRVNCVAPGWIRTQWGEQASDYWQQRACRESLRCRWGEPQDVARAALFLVSPAADFITGQVLPVNGGRADAALRGVDRSSAQPSE
jgi:3-oxoacyl-[acyl-carrier protein] reductase